MSAKRGRVYKPKWKDKKTGACGESSTYWIDFTLDNRRVRENTHTEDRDEAEAILDSRRVKARMDMGRELLPSERADITVSSVLELVEKRYRAKRNRSIKRALTMIGHLRRLVGQVKAGSFNASHVEDYILARRSEREPPISDATIRRELETLLLGFRIAKRRCWIAKVPNLDDSLPPNSEPRNQFFTEDELGRLLEALPPSYRNLVELASIIGWRSNALRTRQFSDIRDNFLHLDRKNSKNKEPYRFPVRGRVAEIVAEQERQRKETARLAGRLPQTIFFDYLTGEPIRYNQLKGQWHRACLAAGLWAVKTDEDGSPLLDEKGEPLKVHTHVFHDLRRTAVRNMDRRGVTEKGIMELAGAVTPAIIRRYNVFDDARLMEESAKLFDGPRQGSGKAAASNA